MKRALSYLGAVASFGFLGASAVINHTFGFALGRTPLEQHTLGVVAILTVAFNGLSPFYMQWSKTRAHWLSGACIWALCVTYTICSAIGFAAENRAGTSGIRVAQHDNLKTTQDMLATELAKKKPDPQKVERLRKDTIAYRNRGAHVAPDNQAALIARLIWLPEPTVRTILVVLFALLIEIGASLGLFASLAHLTPRDTERW